MADGSDLQAEMLADAWLSQQQQPVSQTDLASYEQPQASQPEVDQMAESLADAYMASLSQPPVQPQVASQQSKPKSQPKQKTSPEVPPPPAAPPMGLTAPGQQPAPWAVAADQFAGGILNAARGIPFVGHAVDPMIQQAAAANKEIIRDPITGAVSALASVPVGLAGLVDAAGNTITRGLTQVGPEVHRNNPNNPLAAPFNLAGALKSIPGFNTLQQAAPAQVATGEASGASMVPLHTPVPIANPIARGAVQGAVGGQALGSLMSAGEQARTGPVDYGRAFKEGLPTAAIGAGLGLGFGAAGAAVSKVTKPKAPRLTKPETKVETKPEAETPKPVEPQVQTEVKGEVIDKADMVRLGDGSEFTPDEAVARLRDPATPPEIKQEINNLLDAKDESFAGVTAQEPTRPDFKALGKEPTIEESEQAIRQAFESATTPAEVKQIQSDALNFLRGRFTGPIKKDLTTKINSIAETRSNAVRTRPTLRMDSPDAIQSMAGQGSDFGYKPREPKPEIPPNPEIEAKMSLLNEESRLFPNATRAEGLGTSNNRYQPRELTDAQIQDSLEFLHGRSKGETIEQKALKEELQRREWRKRNGHEQDWPEPEAALRSAEDFAALGEERLSDIADLRPGEEQAYGEAFKILADRQPEAPRPEQAPIEPPAPEGPRFIVEKNTTKKGGYVDIIDTQGEYPPTSSKQSIKRAETLAAERNRLATEEPDKLASHMRRGTKNILNFAEKVDDYKGAVIRNGRPLPEDHPLQQPLKDMAEAKHDFDEARARFEGAADAFHETFDIPQGTKQKPQRVYSAEVEALTQKAQKSKSNDLTVEVNAGRKLEPQRPQFKRGITEDEALQVVESAYQDMVSAEKRLSDARSTVKPDVLGGGISSININAERGPVNIRAVPRQGSALAAKANEVAGPVPTEPQVERSIAKIRKAVKTRRGQAGSSRLLNPLGKGKPTEPLDGVESTIAEALREDARAIKTDLKVVKESASRLMTLRNTGDIVERIAEQFNTDLKTEWDQGFGKLGKAGHEVRFSPDDAGLIDLAMQLEPYQIREGSKVELESSKGPVEVDLSNFSNAQLNYMARTKAVRSRMADAVQETLDLIAEQHPSKTKMESKLLHDVEALEQLRDGLLGIHQRAGTNEAAIFRILSNAINEYLFKWSPRFHLLNFTDLPITGSLRFGIHRLAAASKVIATDPAVRKFLSGVETKSAVDEVRAERNRAALNENGQSKGMIGKIRSLPDIPSDQFNFLGSFAAGAIERGELIGYKGMEGLKAGEAYLKDFAAGKLSPEEEIAAYSHSIQAAHDVTGTGMHGLNKDVIQRTGPIGRAVTLFTSQPVRVARLGVNKTVRAMKSGKLPITEGLGRIASFYGALAFFGGEAVIPKELDALDSSFPQAHAILQAMRDAANSVQLAKHIPVIGRDLTDKLKYNLIPVLGNVRSNLAVEKFERTAEQAAKLDPKGAQSVFFLALSGLLRGGGTFLEQTYNNLKASNQGDKRLYAFDGVGKFPKSAGYKKLTGQDYTVTDALQDSFLPGDSIPAGQFKKDARKKTTEKKLAKPKAPNLYKR